MSYAGVERDDSYYRQREAEKVKAELSSLRARLLRLCYASSDGTEYEHDDHGPAGGDSGCPACWAADIRAVLRKP